MSSPPAQDPAGSPDPSSIDGVWKCAFLSSYRSGGLTYPQPLTMPGFSIHGDAYTAQAGDGSVSYDGSYAEFRGGAFDHWRAAMSQHQDGARFMVFAGDTHRDAKPGDGKRYGNTYCER